MMAFSTKTFALAPTATLGAFSAPALAQTAATPWELKPDTGYAYDKDGKTFSYKMGTNNAGELLKGAKKVPKGTLFFIGHNGQLYMRSGPYLEGDGKFKFGPAQWGGGVGGATALPHSRVILRLVRSCARRQTIQYSRGRRDR